MMDSADEDETRPIVQHRTYAKRWLVLFVLVLLNVCGAMVWLSFVTVPYKAIRFYDTDLATINFLSVVFMISAVVIGALATYVLERYGLKVSLLTAAWCTCIGACLRIASTADTLPRDGKLAILFLGQIIVSLGQPFCMYAPAKTALVWFPDSQRAFATTCGAVANPLGVVIISLVSPLFIDNETNELDVLSLLITTAAPAAFAAILATFVITSPRPPLPPTVGGEEKRAYFGEGLKEVLKNKNYLILLLTIGGSIGLYSAFATLLEQLLCPFGYSDAIVGACTAIQTGLGIVGAGIAGIFCDYTKQFSSVVKTSYACTVLGIVIFCIVFQIYIGYLMLILVGFIGFISFGIYPIGVELGAETTYPVGVATSSGLIMFSGQLQSIILVLLLGSIGRPMTLEEIEENGSKCHFSDAVPATTAATTVSYGGDTTVGPTSSPPPVIYDFSVSVYICAGYVSFLALLIIIFFRPKYLRMNAEKGQTAENEASESSGVSGYKNSSYHNQKVIDEKPVNTENELTSI